MADLKRSSGVQLHLTSLPGGRLGPAAYAFVDWLAAAGQSWWQTLPLCPPDEFRSPYKSDSAFAAWSGFLADPDARVSPSERRAFAERSAFWLDDWVQFAGGDALDDQVRFDREWGALRAYAAERGVRIIGDIPIYVAPDGVDHRRWPELFLEGVVAGTPPDSYAATGQLWGNPLYDWSAMRHTGYRWWIERLRRVGELYDLTRLDHFRGFVAFWAVPASDTSALGGRWRRGPGARLFEAIRAELGEMPLIGEDLGVITPAVERLRDALGLPGMVIMQFGFDPEDPGSPHRLANHRANRIVYTSTHDNDTALGWFTGLAPEQQRTVTAELGVAAAEDVPWALIARAWSSPGVVAMTQAQDILALGSEARMNTPSVEGGNWSWEMAPDALTPELADRLAGLTRAERRMP